MQNWDFKLQGTIVVKTPKLHFPTSPMEKTETLVLINIYIKAVKALAAKLSSVAHEANVGRAPTSLYGTGGSVPPQGPSEVLVSIRAQRNVL